jgi:very-long-chain (3R)-3-hydroxyacyl-CoA dehydratase
MPYAKPSDASVARKRGMIVPIIFAYDDNPVAGPSTPIKAYLVAYNLASAAGWSYVLYLLVQHLSSSPKAPETAAEQAIETAQTLVARLLALIRRALPFLLPPPSTREQVREALPTELHGLWARASTAFQGMGDVTALVQSGAVLEVVHVLLGFVKSPLITTAMQVASRLFLVWGVMERFPEVVPPSFLACT